MIVFPVTAQMPPTFLGLTVGAARDQRLDTHQALATVMAMVKLTAIYYSPLGAQLHMVALVIHSKCFCFGSIYR
jgi:hypothetical protein